MPPLMSSVVAPAAADAAPVLNPAEEARANALKEHQKLLKDHLDRETKLKERTLGIHFSKSKPFCLCTVRQSIKDMEKQYEKSENDIKALQSVGQIIGEVLKQLDEDRCTVAHLKLLC